MKKIIYFLLFAITTSQLVFSQDISIKSSESTENFKWNDIDTIKFGDELQTLELKVPISDITKITFSVNDVDLTKEDKKDDDNILERIYITSESNKSTILKNVEGIISGNEAFIYIPYLTDFSNLKLSFKTKGNVYCNGVLQKSGISAQNFENKIEYKILSTNGNINTYTISVYNSGLPVININSNGGKPISSNWSDDGEISIKENDNKKIYSGTTSIKYKGGKYSTAEKRSFNLKLDKKASLIGLSNGKRYSLQANDDDESLLRSSFAFFIANKLSSNWNQSAQHVELIVNNNHLGNYILTEQTRLGEERVDANALIEINEDFDETDSYFFSEVTETPFIITDNDNIEENKIKEIINTFEKYLYSDNSEDIEKYLSMIDINSFVDWYLFNEIFKNKESAFKANCYIYIDNENKISFSSISDQENYIGNNNEPHDGFILRNEKWFEKLFSNTHFTALVAERFNSMKSEIISSLSQLDTLKNNILYSYSSDTDLWNINNKSGTTLSEKETILINEIDSIKKWLENRLEWLSVRFDNELLLAKEDNWTNDNKILSFSIDKTNNSAAVLSDYTATITDDSIKIFIPYLVNFDLKPKFTISSGASAYIDGEEFISTTSIKNFLNNVKCKIISSNGDIRTYNISIYNSGIPVIYITTPSEITSKDNWTDNVQMTVYLKDGTVNYDSKPDNVQMKGRGNSTWSASTEKRPYAIKQNNKTGILGMLKHKRWILLANYYDATFFRNEFSNFMAKKFTTADWVPSGFNIELVMNGKHYGNYYFCEQAKICDERVPGEYLIEADLKDGTGQIKGIKSGNYFNIKNPEYENNTPEYNYVKEKLDAFETALYGGDWDGLKKLIDLESFADWYVIKELSKDYDGNMYTSCYCHIMEDGIIKMGPIWDFDLAWGGNPFETMMGGFGNYAWYNEPEDYYIGAKEQSSGTNWFLKFFEQQEFRTLVKERIDKMVENMDDIMNFIDYNTDLLRLSASANTVGYSASSSGYGMFNMWGNNNNNDNTKKSYDEEMQVIKDFVRERLLWIQNDLNNRE